MIKKVADAGYAHKSNARELCEKMVPFEIQDDFRRFLDMAEKVFPYDIIKYQKENITLITSPDWDSANEPTVGICRRWKAGMWFDGNCLNYKEMRNFKQVYHNKWQFVADNYKGFDIQAAKDRTAAWNAVPCIDRKRIGYKNYWLDFLKNNGLEE